MGGWIAVLYPTIVSCADQPPLGIKNGSADRDATLGESLARFCNRYCQHCRVVHPQASGRFCIMDVPA
jgi:hypothetical protein